MKKQPQNIGFLRRFFLLRAKRLFPNIFLISLVFPTAFW